MAKLQYDYYRVSIPGECEGDPEKRANMAIHVAREEISKLWVVPCDWAVIKDDGENMVVRRRRNRRVKSTWENPER